MSYRRTLLTRWSRRDKLAILVIAVTVAFLTGTTLVVAAVNTQTTSIAEEYGTHGTAVHYDSVTEARHAAGNDALVVPIATVELPNGATRYVAGISSQQATAFQTRSNLSLQPPPKNGVTSGVQTTVGKVRLAGHRRTLTVHVAPRAASGRFFPADWYVTQPQTVQQLGPSGAYVITPSSDAGPDIPSHGVTIQSVLAFFVAGTRQLLTVLTLTAVGGMVLVGVTVYSVMRMTVRNRRQSIRVLRSTGCRPRTILELFAFRAGLLTAVGVGLGYAIGIILPHIVVNAAISAGLPTSLSVGLSRFVLTVLLPMYAGTILIALLAGGMAAWPTTRTPPARVTTALDRPRRSARSSRNRLRKLFSLRLLDWRALGPSTATLTVFVAVVLLVTSLAGVMTPLMSTSGTTITQPGAIHPVASTVPAQYADALRAKGIPASAEILLFTVHDGNPIVARGVNYSAFATVSNATLERGRRPRSPDEAIIGVDLARTANLEIGDNVSLGGSTTPGLARVKIVGTYAAPGLYDDQLLVSLPIARGLSTKNAGTVHIIRTPKRFEHETTSSVELLDVSAPKQVVSNSSLPVELQLKNFDTAPATHNITLRYRNTTKSVRAHLNASSTRTVTVRLPAGHPGPATLRAGSQTQSVTVVSPNAISVGGLPTAAPPNSTPRITVTTMAGTPVANASVRIRGKTVRTDANGTTRVPLGAAGTTTVHVSAHGQTVAKRVRVSGSAKRTLVADMMIQPSTPSVLSSTRVRIHLYNPWNTTLDRRLQLSGAGDTVQRHVSVSPGGATDETIPVGRQAPGSRTLQLTSDSRRLASTSYTVRGDERLVAAYANSAHGGGGSGIGRALSTAFGNFQLLLVVLVLLAGVMTIGSTTAVFAQATHACQRTIGVYRATGAWPTRVLRLVVLDALTIGVVAVTGALLLGTATLLALDQLNYLVIYGVRISPMLTPSVVLGCVLGGLIIMVVSAALVAGQFSRRSPATLVRNNEESDEVNRVFGSRGSDE